MPEGGTLAPYPETTCLLSAGAELIPSEDGHDAQKFEPAGAGKLISTEAALRCASP